MEKIYKTYLSRLAQELQIIFPFFLLVILFFNILIPKSQFDQAKETKNHLFLAQQLFVTNQFVPAEKEAMLANDLELLRKIQNIKNQPDEVERQILFWQKVVDQFPNYRDAYIKLAILNWKLYRPFDARKYLDKALEIDPNDKVAITLSSLLLVPPAP